MDTRDRYVIVRAAALDDLCALSLQAAEDLELRYGTHPLASEIHGTVADIRTSVIADPHPATS
jgi:hypothetical protein